jgi:DNA repair protein RadC
MLPREKFQKRGISVLSDIELIQIIVGSGIKGMDFVQISKSIMREIKKGIEEGDGFKVSSFTKIGGVGEVLAMRILCSIELGKRVYGLYDTPKIRITNSQQAYEIYKDLATLKRERVDIICLNSRFEYISRECIALGSLNCAKLSPREVLYSAIESNSAFVIMAHNHPSGDSTPSKEDVVLTKSISDSLDMVGIELLDHIVIAIDGWHSIEI